MLALFELQGSRSERIRCSTTHHAGFPEDPPASDARAAGDPDAGKVDKDAPGLEDQDPRAEGSPSPGSEADPSTESAPGAHGALQPLLFVLLCTCARVGISRRCIQMVLRIRRVVEWVLGM